MSKFKRRYPDPCTPSFVTVYIFVGSFEYAARILSGLINFEFDGKIGIKFIDLANELEKALGLKVDLVSKKGIKEQYLNTILSDLIYV